MDIESDEIHKETIEIDFPKEQPEIMEITPSQDTTMVKQVVEHKISPSRSETFEIQIGLPQVTRTSTTLIQEKTTYTQVTRNLVEEETPSLSEGPEKHISSVTVRKGQETIPIELRVSIPVQPVQEELVSHITEATRVVTSEVRQIPVEEKPTEERHRETIEIIQESKPQEVPIQIPVTKIETVEVRKDVDHRRESVQRIEIEIHETQLQRLPQPQELSVPISKITKTEFEFDIVAAPATETPRPTEEVVEETRQTITKEIFLMEGETQQPQPVIDKTEIEFVTLPIESTTDIDETEVKAPLEELVITEREIIEKSAEIPSEVQMEVELVPEEKPEEEEALSLEESYTVEYKPVETQYPTTQPIEEFQVEGITEEQMPEETAEVKEAETSAPSEEIIITTREIVEKAEDIVPSEVQMEIELVPEEKPEEQEAVRYEETVLIQIQDFETGVPTLAPTAEFKVEDVFEVQIPEVATDAPETETKAPVEEVVITEKEYVKEAEKVLSEVEMEIELVLEEQPEEQETVALEETLTAGAESISIETQISVPLEQTQVESVIEIQESEATADIEETEVKAPFEEVVVVERKTVEKSDKIPYEVHMEIELIPEDEKPQEQAPTFEETVIIETQPDELDNLTSASRVVTQVDVRESPVVDILDVVSADLAEKQVSEVFEIPQEEVTLEIKIGEREGIEPEFVQTDVSNVVISEVEEVKEIHREEIELQIKGREVEQQEVQFTLQIAPTEISRSELEVPVAEDVFLGEDSFVSEVEISRVDTEVEERHREELTLQIEGKQKELEEVQLTLHLEEEEQLEETPVTEVAAPSVEQVKRV